MTVETTAAYDHSVTTAARLGLARPPVAEFYADPVDDAAYAADIDASIVDFIDAGAFGATVAEVAR